MFELSTSVNNPRQWEAGDFSAYDALYLGDFSCPEFAGNFSARPELLEEAVKTIKAAGKKCYLRLYAVPSNHDLPWVRKIIETAMSLPFDALEVHNMGLLRTLREMGNPLPVHLGVFGNLYTHATARVLKDFGVERVYPNPELSLKEIAYIARETPVDVLVPVHGKMPLVISETCFIVQHADNLTEKSCGNLCSKDHWLTRGQQGWSLKDTGRMTVSGKDLCMLEHLDTLVSQGLRHFFVQNHCESEAYTATVGRIYRDALNDAMEKGSPGNLSGPMKTLGGLAKMGLCNGYYFESAGRRYVGRG